MKIFGNWFLRRRSKRQPSTPEQAMRVLELGGSVIQVMSMNRYGAEQYIDSLERTEGLLPVDRSTV